MEHSMKELLAAAKGSSIGRAARAAQARQDGASEEALNQKMHLALAVMRQSAADGMDYSLRSLSGMSGGQAPRLRDAVEAGRTCSGPILGMAGARAMSVAECNACMGKIVAAPTAGACGILPAALLTVAEARGLEDDALVEALFTAAAVGQVIANRAGISGAKGGCQAETGSAAAMAAAALCEMLGGTPERTAHACGFALMATMGLVCDPVGGLVEVPCVFRNVSGVAIALSCADMALAGIVCPMPADEIIDAMSAVGDLMHPSLRETGEGGCAACPSCAR